MKFQEKTTLKAIADFLGFPFKGNENLMITGINEIHMVEKGDIVFVDHSKYYNKALTSAADVILIDKDVEFPEGKGIIICDSPFDAFNKITKHHSPYKAWTNSIGESFTKGDNTIIHPNAVIGHNVTIGNNCVIHAGATLGDNTWIGNDVVVGPNSVIGHDAFYYKKKPEGYDRMHSVGRAVLEDRVEIGALSTIDKGVSGDTTIGEGTKIDNQVHVGHDTQVGKNCLFAANVGIAGCAIIEDNVILWGQVGVVSDVVIGEGAVVYGQSGVGKNLEGGKTYLGSPCDDARSKFKELAALKKLPSYFDNL